MAEKVGSIYYSVELDTGEMIAGQRKVDKELKNTSNSLDGLKTKLTAVTSAIGAYAAALYVIRQSDAFTKFNAQLVLATDSSRELATAQAEVRKIANEAQISISGVGVLYARITNATKELGTSQKTVGDITRTVALALKVSGATAQEAASATLQLSQAFGSGVLRGEEFNAVNEAAPRLMKALADGIGVPIGQLRGMAEAGKLTSEVLANALPKALGDLEKESSKIQTISGAFEQLNNELLLFIGQQTTASGTAKLTADAIGIVANNLDLLAAAAIGFAAAKLASVLLAAGTAATTNTVALIQSIAAQRAATLASQAQAAATVAETAAKLENLALSQAALVISRQELAAKLANTNQTIAQAAAQSAAAKAAGSQSFALAILREAELTTAAAQASRNVILGQMAVLGTQQAAVTAALTTATAANTAAQVANTAAQRAAGVAGTVASRALGLLGGPIGLITTLLGLGVTAWTMWGDSSKKSEKTATDAVAASTDEIIDKLDKQIAKLKERNALASAGLPDIAKSGGESADKIASLQKQIADLQAGKGINGSAPLPEAARVDLLQKLLVQYGTLVGKVRELKVEEDIASGNTQKAKASDWLVKYATDLERVNAEVAKAKKELGDAFTPELEQRIRQKIMPDKKVQKTADQKFDDSGYLAGLEAKSLEAWDRIAVIETEAKRKNDVLLAEKKISAETHEKAVTLITADALSERQKLMDSDFQKALSDGERRIAEKERQTKAEKQAEDQRKSNLDVAKRDIAGVNPIDAIRFEEEQKIAVLEAYRLQDLTNTQTYEDAKKAIHTKAAADVKAVQDASMVAQLQGYGSLFGGIADITKTFAGEQDGTYQALFAASKAFAIADAIVKIQSAYASAFTDPSKVTTEQKIGAMATIAGATSSIVSTISGTNYGGARQYGGPASAGSMYRVNETGAPEMFTANNGNQYMLPSKSGKVTSADNVGGGGISVVVNVDASGSSVEGDDNRAKQFGAMLGNAILAKMVEQKRPGGILA